MHGSGMASATSICEALRRTLSGEGSEIKRLGDAALLLHDRLGVAVDFCEILGGRWSHISGHPGLLTPLHRIHLSPRRGMLAGEIPAEIRPEWEAVVECLRRAMTSTSFGG